MRYAYLLKVEPDANNNKFYEMKENPDGKTFTAYYGRVDSTPSKKPYPISDWDRIYKEKTGPKKEYKDITEYRAVKEIVTGNGNGDIIKHNSSLVQELLTSLQNAAKQTVKTNYNIAAVNVVTQAMIDDAQAVLNDLADSIKMGTLSTINPLLVKLYHIIPRKMGHVRDYTLGADDRLDRAQELLGNEQDLLNNLRGQVYVHNTESDQGQSLLDALGLKASECSKQEINMIIDKLGDSRQRFINAIKITHNNTRQAWEQNNRSMSNELRLEWHGSRTENWLSILSTGLVLYPTSAVITGKMFGYGLYFAPRAKKSIGYTSVANSYWANGRDNYGYLGLFDLNLGRVLNVNEHKYTYSSLTKEGINRMGYDSLHAHAGRDLQNDEIIVYDPPQATVGYIVRIK